MRVVLDTSVLVAAARSKRGASNALLDLLPCSAFTPAVSVSAFIEYRDVLLRPENLLHRPADQAEAFLDFLLSVSFLQKIHFLWRPALPDPDDDLFLELAVAARCAYIITHNIRDFRGAEKWGVSAATPADFLRKIKVKT
jgi:putative PIN family toxin of toxin-antitoxin system